MKKLIVFCSMIVALGFVAIGCGGSNSKPAPATPEATQPDDSATTTENAGAGEASE